jgi:uncharacterized protein (DUF427 family)
MTLTLAHGLLAEKPQDTVNFRVDGPDHKLLFDPFPRRIRAVFEGEVVVDSRQAMQLHETTLLPQLYVPEGDIRADLREPTDHHTRCPFKGQASYWSVRVGDRVAENAVWTYAEPTEAARWLRGYLGIQFDAMDAWFDEDEEIAGHIRDPYHRVDVRQSSQHVRVLVGDEVVAESTRPKLLSETGVPNRYYIPRDDVRGDVLQPSGTHTVCPYKGTASYHTLVVDGRRFPDAVWFYPEPLDGVFKIQGHLAFVTKGDVNLEVDGRLVG